MSFLDQLTDSQKDMLISLPYRVGLWISQSDDSGGDEANTQELQTLSNVIDGFARDVFGSEMIQYVMREAFIRKDQWGRWAESSGDVPADCAEALSIISAHGDQKDVYAFRNHLIEIAEAIALSFSEYREGSGLDRLALKLGFYIENFKASVSKQKKKTMHEFLSISTKERVALNDLAAALGTKY